MRFLSIFNTKEAILFIFSLLSYGLLVLNEGLYWDDWVEVYSSAETINRMFTDAGLPMRGWVHNALSTPLMYQWVTFFSIFASALLCLKIFVVQLLSK